MSNWQDNRAGQPPTGYSVRPEDRSWPADGARQHPDTQHVPNLHRGDVYQSQTQAEQRPVHQHGVAPHAGLAQPGGPTHAAQPHPGQAQRAQSHQLHPHERQPQQPGHDPGIRQSARNPDPGTMDFIAGERDVSAYLKAHRHSGLVRALRVALPIVGVVIIVAIAGAWYVSQSNLPQVTIAETTIDDGRMVMKNPELKGVDSQQRPYLLKAIEAVQDTAKPSLVELSEIDAHVPMDANLNARIKAGFGFYDSEAKTLKLGGEVDVKTDDGMIIQMQDADVDIDAGSLVTENPVMMDNGQAKISAQKFQVRDNGKTIVFEDRVRMTIFPDKVSAAANASEPAKSN